MGQVTPFPIRPAGLSRLGGRLGRRRMRPADRDTMVGTEAYRNGADPIPAFARR